MLFPAAYLHLLADIDHPLLDLVVGRQRVERESLGDDDEHLGQVLVAGAQDGGVVALHQVAQVPVHVGGLVDVLEHWQPGEPGKGNKEGGMGSGQIGRHPTRISNDDISQVIYYIQRIKFNHIHFSGCPNFGRVDLSP